LLTACALQIQGEVFLGLVKAADRNLSPAQVRLTSPKGHQKDPVDQKFVGLIRILKPRSGGHCPLAFSPDGKTLATCADYCQICIWDSATGEEKRRLRAEQDSGPKVYGLAFSPDGKVLASGHSSHQDKLAVRLWAVESGKVMRDLKVPEGAVGTVAFSPDGKILAGVASDKVYLWAAATGKELHRLERGYPCSSGYGLPGLAFSPDGRAVAAGSGNQVTVWDAVTGKTLRQVNGKGYFFAFTPDGQTLIAGGAIQIPRVPLVYNEHDPIYPIFYFWDLTTGTERRCLLSQIEGWFTSLVLSPDGRTLITGGPGPWVRLWEVGTGKERRRLGPHESYRFTLALAPDGRKLATSDWSNEVRLWDIEVPLAGKESLPRKPSAKDLEAQWTELGSDNAFKGYEAICTLMQWPEATIGFLRDRLQELPMPDPKRIPRVIKDLDSDRYEVRQAALKELERMPDLAEPALRRALADKPSLEARRRIEEFLEKYNGFVRSPQRLQAIRALETLERIGTAEAQEALKKLAAGTPSILTQEARRALERLAKRPATVP
jgi:WD40 repeat protein